MGELTSQLWPSLIKASPYLATFLAVAGLAAKSILSYLKDRDEKKAKLTKEIEDEKAKLLKERDDKRDQLFKETLAARELFFTDQLDKKDEIIHEKDGELRAVRLEVAALFKEDIEVRKNNNVVMDNLSKLLEVALRQKS